MLKELRDNIKKVLKNKNKASEILPTMSGFFFGQTIYGDYYFNELKKTLKVFDNLFKSKDYKDYIYLYLSSW